MANDDSNGFPGDADRTIFIPRPGGRGPASAASPPQPPPSRNYHNQGQPEFDVKNYINSGVNPLASVASALIALPNQLLAMASHNDIAGLRNQVLEEIRTFETRAQVSGIDANVTNTSRYVICAFIDEAVLNTIWGSNSTWANQSLLSTLHNETSGGETFFVVLDRLLKDPNGSLDLLELMFLCISLGFKGRYSMMDRGQERLEELRNIVFEHIRRRRGEYPQELSPHWQSQSSQRSSLRNFVPLWVVAAVAGALLFAIFIGFTMVLEETTDPVLEALEDIAKPLTIEKSTDN